MMKRFFVAIFALIMLCSCGLCFNAAADAPETDPESPLYQKKVLFVGDSICEAQCEWGKELVGWPGRIMAWNEMEGINKGKSGASISNCRGANTVYYQLMNQSKNQFDYVIIHGGVNDAWDAAPVGVMTEGFDAEFDQSTFAGGLEATFQYAKETFKDAYFGYIINFRIKRDDIGNLSDMSQYFDVAKQICDKWEIPYIDLYNDTEFNEKVLFYDRVVFLPDYIHPNTGGFDVIAPVINDWMETIPEYYEKLNEVSVEESVEATVSEEISAPATEESGNSDLVIYIICGVVVVIAIAAVIVVVKKK